MFFNTIVVTNINNTRAKDNFGNRNNHPVFPRFEEAFLQGPDWQGALFKSFDQRYLASVPYSEAEKFIKELGRYTE